jgi:uncharacterized protein
VKKREVVLAALASSEDAIYDPVHLQKLLFLIDMKLGKKIGGPIFDFVPYHYGPFDRSVYDAAESLAEEGLVEIESDPGLQMKTYRLTKRGRREGRAILEGMSEKTREYLSTLAEFVLGLTFEELVSAIYKSYPDMKANSVFRG